MDAWDFLRNAILLQVIADIYDLVVACVVSGESQLVPACNEYASPYIFG